MDFDEFLLDAKLKIDTIGRDDKYSDTYRYPYEPTAYAVLERIAESGYITRDDLLIDYGSGKGRVPIYFNDKVGCRAIGIEMMEEFFSSAEKNRENYRKKNEVSFAKTTAEAYVVPEDATCFFFFNPFSIHVFREFMNNILLSYEQAARTIDIILYYPSPDYLQYLQQELALESYLEMKLRHEKNENERIIIFRIQP